MGNAAKLAGGESLMGKMAGRSTLQDMVKSAMVESAKRVRVSEEARTQEQKIAGVRIAALGGAENTSKVASAQQVEKLASALDFLALEFDKEGAMGGAYSLSGSTAATAPPPGVSAATASKSLPDHKGQGVHVVPMHPGQQKGLKTEQSPTQMDNTLEHAAGGNEKMVQKNASALSLIRQKLASEKEEKEESEGLAAAKKGVEKAEKAHEEEPENKKASMLVEYMLAKTKAAEDAINPAHITAGAAVAPETSASGEAGGQPAGGAPQGPTDLVGSNESAINYTRGAAYGNRKSDLKSYFNEPAQSAEHDHTLRDAFDHTSQAGPKLGSAPTASVKTAAARALLMNMAKTAEAEAGKNTNGSV
jgi:hypothetical protein